MSLTLGPGPLGNRPAGVYNGAYPGWEGLLELGREIFQATADVPEVNADEILPGPDSDGELTKTKDHRGTSSRRRLPSCWAHERCRLGRVGS